MAVAPRTAVYQVCHVGSPTALAVRLHTEVGAKPDVNRRTAETAENRRAPLDPAVLRNMLEMRRPDPARRLPRQPRGSQELNDPMRGKEHRA
jgi:hypothetical protein